MKFLWSIIIVLLLATCNNKSNDNQINQESNASLIEPQKLSSEAGLLYFQTIPNKAEFGAPLPTFEKMDEEDKTTELTPKWYTYQKGIDTAVYITGTIKGKAEPHIKIIQPHLFKRDVEQTIAVNDQAFEQSITIKKAGYYKLQHRKNKYDVFLTPGDSINLVIDHSTDEGLKFTGKTQDANNYLRCAYLQDKAMKVNEVDMVNQKFKKFKKQVNGLKAVRANDFETLLAQDGVNLSEDFVEQEKANIQFAWARKHLKYQKTNIDNPRATLTSDGRYFNELKFDADYFDIYHYQKFLYEYFDFFSKKYLNDTYGKDGKYEYTPEERALKRYNRINFLFKDAQIREYLKVHLVYDMIEQTKKPLVNPLVSKLKKDVKDKEYLAMISRHYHQHVPMDDGVFAPDFVVKDQLGNPLKLNDLKGKWAYIAVWATWCAPCKIEQPHLEILKKEYAENKNIEIFSVSIDEEPYKWRNALRERQITAPQYIAPGNWNSSFAEAFDLRSVPKYILIDPEGQINDLSTSKPSADIRLKFDVLGI